MTTVPKQSLMQIEDLEDARDDRDAELAKAVAEARTAGTVPLADVLREHGL